MRFESSNVAEFPSRIFSALARVKCELQSDYARAYPALRQIIRLVLEEEEAKAWELSRDKNGMSS